ncbi:MAG: 3-oxoacid CoA-transferase subunit B [Christensenellaceae bacterium]
MLNDNEYAKQIIAKRIAQELQDGDVVNLGVGIPTLVVDYLAEDTHVVFVTDNGIIGMGPTPDEFDKDVVGAGGFAASILPYGSFCDSNMAFSIMRGGHLDKCVIGALQVDEHGNLASWIIPGESIHGMGGAMDLAVGAKQVLIAMQHTANGKPKLVKNCNLPLTAPNCVDKIVTELGVFKITPSGFLLTERFWHTTVEEIKQCCEADITVSKDLKIIAE